VNLDFTARNHDFSHNTPPFNLERTMVAPANVILRPFALLGVLSLHLVAACDDDSETADTDPPEVSAEDASLVDVYEGTPDIVVGDAVGAETDTSPPLSAEEVIEVAGNTASEVERYALLQSLTDRDDLEPSLREELESLLPIIDQWANGLERYWVPGDQPTAGEGGYLAGYFQLKVWPTYGNGEVETLPPRISEDSPLYPVWALYRGRLLIWSGIQTGSFVNNQAGRDAWYGEGRALLEVAAEAYPDNEIALMYLGTPIEWSAMEPDTNAPQWANLQREALTKVYEVIRFWIDQRQASDGQFGGGWGDDVEMWRWWAPLLIGFDDPTLVDAQRLLSEGIFALPRLAGGYTNIMTDVEHAAEDTSDAITAMLLARPEDEVWRERAARIAELMRDNWTERNERGLLQFPSAYFTAEAVSDNDAYACDTAYHARAVQPILHLWQETGDPELGDLVVDWMTTWVDTASRSESGKPAGIMPTAIHWPSGDAGGPNDDWWTPGCALNAGAFEFPGALGGLTQALVLTWHMTGDESFLAPIVSMAEARRAYINDPVDNPERGGMDWAASKLRGITEPLARYRGVTNDDSFDDLLLARADGYIQFRITGDIEPVINDLQRMMRPLRVNEASYTTEVRYTDRVRKFADNYLNYYLDEEIPSLDTDFLFEMLTGSFGDASYFPQQSVRWVTSPVDFAAMVTAVDDETVEADFYVFDDTDRELTVMFPALDDGQWTATVSCEGQPDQTIVVSDGAVALNAAARSLCSIAVQRSGEQP
jgi:hypothetical protein